MQGNWSRWGAVARKATRSVLNVVDLTDGATNMLYVLTRNGDLRPATNRLPSAEHWNVYRRALKEHPDIVREMYNTIVDVVSRREYLESDGRFPNSTWIGSQILVSWPRLVDWNNCCAHNLETSNALFGQIMWTVMFDHPMKWCTTVTPNANIDREERVYWLHPESKAK